MDDDDESTVDGTVRASYRAHISRQVAGDPLRQPPRWESGEAAAQREGGGGRNTAHLEEELESLRQMIATTSQGTVEAKYLEQVRRNRELNVRFEAEKARTQKLTQRVVALERERLQEQEDARRGVQLPSQRAGVSSAPGGVKPPAMGGTEEQTEELRTKLSAANKSIAALRKQNDELKREANRMRKVVALEVGEEKLVERAMECAAESEPGTPTKRGPHAGTRGESSASTGSAAAQKGAGGAGWRGRAQQITLLRSKVKDLERQLGVSTSVAGTEVGNRCDFAGPSGGAISGGPPQGALPDVAASAVTTTITGQTGAGRRDVDELSRVTLAKKQHNLRSEVLELEKVVQQRDEALEREKQRADSVAARLHILERDNQHLKNCIQRIIEKTENDDKLIAAYKEELEIVRHAGRRPQDAGASGVAGWTDCGKDGGHSDPRAAEVLERENARLLEHLEELRADLHAARRANVSVDGSSAARNVADDEILLAQIEAAAQLSESDALLRAQDLIREQREALLALEGQLQRRERGTLNADSKAAISSLVREENAALKERIGALTALMDKEIAMYRSIAEAAQRRAACPTVADEGRRPASASQATAASSAGTDSSAGATRPSSVPSLPPVHGVTPPALHDELAQLRGQYAELKRAYNSQQTQMMKLQQRRE